MRKVVKSRATRGSPPGNGLRTQRKYYQQARRIGLSWGLFLRRGGKGEALRARWRYRTA